MVRIAKRYAKALFGQHLGDLPTARRERDQLVGLKALFAQKEAGKVLRSPVMPLDLKRSLLEYGLKQVDADDDVKKLVDTVLTSGRVDLLPEVADAYAGFVDDAEGRVRAELISALPLKPEDVQQVEAALARMLHKQTVEVTQRVDGALLGGFVVRVGNFRIDLSLKTKLDGLASAAVQDSSISL